MKLYFTVINYNEWIQWILLRIYHVSGPVISTRNFSGLSALCMCICLCEKEGGWVSERSKDGSFAGQVAGSVRSWWGHLLPWVPLGGLWLTCAPSGQPSTQGRVFFPCLPAGPVGWGPGWAEKSEILLPSREPSLDLAGGIQVSSRPSTGNSLGERLPSLFPGP